jgi:hypothetical protein
MAQVDQQSIDPTVLAEVNTWPKDKLVAPLPPEFSEALRFLSEKSAIGITKNQVQQNTLAPQLEPVILVEKLC